MKTSNNQKHNATKALQEAEERQKNNQQTTIHTNTKEINGYKGLDPTRYGDWEKNGITSDF